MSLDDKNHKRAILQSVLDKREKEEWRRHRVVPAKEQHWDVFRRNALEFRFSSSRPIASTRQSLYASLVA